MCSREGRPRPSHRQAHLFQREREGPVSRLNLVLRLQAGETVLLVGGRAGAISYQQQGGGGVLPASGILLPRCLTMSAQGMKKSETAAAR